MNVPVTISITAEDIVSGTGRGFDTRLCPGALAFARALPRSFVELFQTVMTLRWPNDPMLSLVRMELPPEAKEWIKRFDGGAPDMTPITFTVMVPEEMG